MKEPLKQVSEIVAKANDLFYQKHTDVNTIIGIIDKALRQQGMNTDAVTIDCIAQDKKLVLLMHDERPDTIDLAFGNKAGDIFASSHLDMQKLSVEQMLDLLESNFVVKKH